MRKFNFCAGPAALPEPVLLQAQQELLDWQGRGCSVMEVSHRSPEYVEVAQQAEQDLRDLLSIPSNYKVLFLQGGASAQFGAVPLNLMQSEKPLAQYIHSGHWANKAIAEARRFGEVTIAGSSEDKGFTYAPAESALKLDPAADYLHYTPNETIGGVEFPYIPDSESLGVPLVADMSSNILSRPLDVSRFGVIYAGAQKNIGPSGLAVVIVREDLLDRARPEIPRILHWRVSADADSMDNTPPTFAWYLAGLVFKWLKEVGGLEAMEELNRRKAEKLYAYIDGSDFYSNPIARDSRSRMNVPFVLRDDSLDGLFLQQSKDAGLLNLKGHRVVGGMRASIYNAIPEEAVDALISFMDDFARQHG
ncbi:3-phosphoserine/phosphohydroxythreonine transaminase [Biformimicrobium ophioploci]|uniref:3-phosphoserine/phosphohydroxythreonine transaminase n=1 Tax=Biformimicrobium ophioploci TaxID=3036711 RepID=UPI00255432F3|nr:3-phosphoserine/phosphohydroxythreonine transaminase [Microbulbifer sp. NKW57]